MYLWEFDWWFFCVWWNEDMWIDIGCEEKSRRRKDTGHSRRRDTLECGGWEEEVLAHVDGFLRTKTTTHSDQRVL